MKANAAGTPQSPLSPSPLGEGLGVRQDVDFGGLLTQVKTEYPGGVLLR
jgi:hypothetical protein